MQKITDNLENTLIFQRILRRLVTIKHNYDVINMISNSSFPSWLLPLCQSESWCETVYVKICSAYRFSFTQIKLIFN